MEFKKAVVLSGLGVLGAAGIKKLKAKKENPIEKVEQTTEATEVVLISEMPLKDRLKMVNSMLNAMQLNGKYCITKVKHHNPNAGVNERKQQVESLIKKLKLDEDGYHLTK